MKFKFSILITFLAVLTCLGQESKCCETYVYQGYILDGQNKKRAINLNFLVLLDSTIVGSYFSAPQSGSLKLVGKLNPDQTFNLVERNSEEVITGYFEGLLASDFKFASGKWTQSDKTDAFTFEIIQVTGKSYWDVIQKNRALFEHTDMPTIIKEKDNVLSIDLSGKGLDKLPQEFIGLSKVVSINLLGNSFESFPSVLAKLPTLDEISLSSNKLKRIGSEIAELKNLRILIINNNQLKKLPVEIGELTKLLYLEIGNNQLTSLPNEIQNLINLQELHLERNQLAQKEKDRIKKLLPNCVVHF